MLGVQQAIRRFAMPLDADDQAGIEGRNDPLKDRHGAVRRESTFDPRDQLLGDADARGQVDLAPASAPTEGADDAAETDGVHADTMSVGASWWLTRSLLASARPGTSSSGV